MRLRHIISTLTIATLPMGAMAQGLSSGLNPADMDTSVRPGDSFYQYACGGWIKSHPLPAAYSRYGSFDKLAEDNNIRINTLLTELLQGKGYEKGTIEQKLSDFYKLAMDSTRRNKEGVAPIKPILKEMDKAKSVAQLKAVQIKYAPFGYGLPFGAGFGADEKNASQNILSVNQGGIALGQKEYYTDTDEATTAIREAYKTFIANMFKLCDNNKETQQAVQDIMKIETVLAKASKSRTELRDVEANYNKTTMADFEKLYPNLPLKKVFMAEGVKEEHLRNIVVGQPQFLAEADKLFATLTPGELRHYMQWNVILGAANYLSDEMSNEYFNFFGKTMRGRKEDYPRWKRATNQVESQMGEALGRMYVAKYFPAAAKERMQNLVKQLQISLAERIEKQTWMSEDTKKAALDKLMAARGRRQRREIVIPVRDIVERGSTRFDVVARGDVERAKRAVLATLCQSVDFDLVAAKVGLSRRTLQKRFRSVTGETLKSWTERQRLAAAQARLRDGASFRDAALSCGYGSARALTKAFRRFANTSFRAWRTSL